MGVQLISFAYFAYEGVSIAARVLRSRSSAAMPIASTQYAMKLPTSVELLRPTSRPKNNEGTYARLQSATNRRSSPIAQRSGAPLARNRVHST
jgi:hypothetical protein